MLRLCRYHGLQRWLIIQDFYNGVTQPVQYTINDMAGGTLMNKTKDEAYNLIEEMTHNNFQWSLNGANTNELEVSLKLMCLLCFLLK